MPTEINIRFHADDYGFFTRQAGRILACIREGCLNSVSIVSTVPELPFHMAELRKAEKETGRKIYKSLHVNLVEGRSLSPAGEIPHLVNADGIFRPSFLRYLLVSFFGSKQKKQVYFRELKTEIAAQIRALLPYLTIEDGFRIDSHCHYHAVPIVFRAMLAAMEETLGERKYQYIRIPREVPSLYLSAGQKPRLINWIKVCLLNSLCFYNNIRFRAQLKQNPGTLFLGVMQSGQMTYGHVTGILPAALGYCRKRKLELEILFHPGGVEETEDLRKVTFFPDREFFRSAFRRDEAEALMRFAEQNKKSLHIYI